MIASPGNASSKDVVQPGSMNHVATSSNHSNKIDVISNSNLNPSTDSVDKKNSIRIGMVSKGVYKFPGFYYVSPMIVDDLSKYLARINFYGQITAGTLIAFGPGIYSSGLSTVNNETANAFFQFRAGFGLEIIIRNFYFGFGIDAYGLIGGIVPDSVVVVLPTDHNSVIHYTIPLPSAGQQEWVFGYKWRFMIGGIVYFGNNKYVKIYASYSDTQLQVGGGLWQSFGYFSRTPGVGVMFRLAKGFEFGVEADFTLMHAGSLGDSSLYDFPSALIQGVLRIGF